jgi:hypothetical protein
VNAGGEAALAETARLVETIRRSQNTPGLTIIKSEAGAGSEINVTIGSLKSSGGAVRSVDNKGQGKINLNVGFASVEDIRGDTASVASRELETLKAEIRQAQVGNIGRKRLRATLERLGRWGPAILTVIPETLRFLGPYLQAIPGRCTNVLF